jgi:MFS transporter, DHA1 family, multidrug resistance protein
VRPAAEPLSPPQTALFGKQRPAPHHHKGSAVTRGGAPSSALPTPALGFSKHQQVLAIGLLLSLQPIATDTCLPALPVLAQDLGATAGAAQLTLSALILAFGLAQLVWGPVADRVGRRPVLLLGLALYTGAAIGAAWAPNLTALVLWRALQGVGVAATVVCARAMLRDLYEPAEGAKQMSMALSGLGVVAVLSPFLGGWVTWAWGWRATMGLTALCGAASALYLLRRLPETLAAPDAANAQRLSGLLAQSQHILQHPVFWAWTLLLACSYGGLFVLLSGSSFAYMTVLGLSAKTYGALMALNALCYLVGTVACRRLITRYGVAGAVRRGALVTLASGLGFAVLDLSQVQAVWGLLLPQCLFALGHGIHQPCAQTAAIGPFSANAGLASALAGFVLALTAFFTGLLLGQATNDGTRPFALGVAVWAFCTCAVAWTLVRRSATRAA